MNPSSAEIPTQAGPRLRWFDGFMLALPVATGVFVSIGFVIGAVGAVPAATMCAVLSVVAVLQNRLFAEMAAMFPDQAGGVATFAVEAWKRYFTPIGSIAAFGYWLGWAAVMALLGLTIGSLLQAQWFPGQTWVLFTIVNVPFGFPQLVSLLTLLAATGLNVVGIGSAIRVNQIVGIAFLAVLVVIIAGPFVAGEWNSIHLTSHVNGGWVTFTVWLYISAWAIYGTELAAVFAPEYRNTTRDTSRALNSVALIMVAVYTLVPLATTGQLGELAVASNPVTYGVASVAAIWPGLSGVITAVLCAGLFATMISASADASRALYGLAGAGVTLRQFGRLDRRGAPLAALLFTLALNLGILFLVGNPVAILLAGNLGYLLAITLAVIGFILLRRDRPNWIRPIRLPNVWIPIAALVAAFNVVLITVGVMRPDVTSTAGHKDVLIGALFLLVGVAMSLWRSVIQDKRGLQLRVDDRDKRPARPDDVGDAASPPDPASAY